MPSAQKNHRISGFLRNFKRWIILMGIWGMLFFVTIIVWFSADLPNIEDLVYMSRQPSIVLLDCHGEPLGARGDFYGKPIHAKDLPDHLIHALLAIEDRRFYTHWGVDPMGLLRAMLCNMKAGKVVQGGSTITQQLAKNFLQSKKIYGYRDRSFHRKIAEALLAFRIERRFTKEEILTMHLNRVYMGSGTFGIQGASLKYFGVDAKDLGLYESAILMGLLQAPSAYSPAVNHIKSENRGKQVLNAMVKAGFITQDAAEAAMALPVPVVKNATMNVGQYFVDWIIRHVRDHVDGGCHDMVVKTTLDLSVQKIAEKQAIRVMETVGKQWKAEQISLVSMTPDGAVRAMVGGLNYARSPYNRSTQSLRQTGSIFKFFTYLTALEEGYLPSSTISDHPITLGKWRAKNFKHKSIGYVSLEYAFAKSINTSSIRLAKEIGLPSIMAMVRRLGITTPIPEASRNYSMALGTCGFSLLEMLGAFGVVANDGYAAKPYGIEEIRTPDGKLLYQHKRDVEDPLIDPVVVEEMKTLLHAVMRIGTGRNAVLDGVKTWGKTGTSNKGKDDRDLWFIGMTKNLVTGVWAGCDDEKPMPHQKNGSPALILWREFTAHTLNYQQDPSRLESILSHIEKEDPTKKKAVIFDKELKKEAYESAESQTINPLEEDNLYEEDDDESAEETEEANDTVEQDENDNMESEESENEDMEDEIMNEKTVEACFTKIKKRC